MAKKIFDIDNKYVFSRLNWSDTKPRGWYIKDNKGNKTYMFFSLNIEKWGKDEKTWAISFVFGPAHFMIGSPYLIQKYQKEFSRQDIRNLFSSCFKSYQIQNIYQHINQHAWNELFEYFTHK